MPNSSLLLRLPAFPFTIDALRPNRYLATLAAQIKIEHGPVSIRDFGTVEGMERLAPQDSPFIVDDTPSRPAPLSSLLDRWRGIAHPQQHSTRQRDAFEFIAQEIIDDRKLSCVFFCIDRKEDLESLTLILPTIRYFRPKLTLIGVGDFFRNNETHLVDGVSLFDCVYWGEGDDHFAAFLSVIDAKDRWKEIPHLAFSDTVRLVITREDEGRKVSALASPDYSRETYPALHRELKLRVFDVEEVRIGPNNKVVGIKSPESVSEEIEQITNESGSRAFHITGATRDRLHAEALAYEILARRLHIRYTRDCHVASTPSSTVTALRSSGCYGTSFQIGTGSQRLLDLHYDAGFTVTEVEQTMRACSFSNLFTVMEFFYPCIEDDYHTKAETLRLIERAKPHSAPFLIPIQNEQRKTDLKRRFLPFSKSRSLAEIRSEHGALCDEVEQLGIPTRITAPVALMAELAGFRGHEVEYLEETVFQLMTADAEGLRSMVEAVNLSAAQPDAAVRFKPFSTYQDVVGN